MFLQNPVTDSGNSVTNGLRSEAIFAAKNKYRHARVSFAVRCAAQRNVALSVAGIPHRRNPPCICSREVLCPLSGPKRRSFRRAGRTLRRAAAALFLRRHPDGHGHAARRRFACRCRLVPDCNAPDRRRFDPRHGRTPRPALCPRTSCGRFRHGTRRWHARRTSPPRCGPLCGRAGLRTAPTLVRREDPRGFQLRFR